MNMKKIKDKKVYIGNKLFTIEFIPVKKEHDEDPIERCLKHFGLRKIKDK